MATHSDKLVVYTATTPNGLVPLFVLEELRATYGAPDFELVVMSLLPDKTGEVHNHAMIQPPPQTMRISSIEFEDI